MSKGNGKKNGEKNGKKSSVESSMVVQPHGGAIQPGAGGGTQPGAGRPPSAIREACRLAFAERLPVLVNIAADEDARDLDRISAMAALGKYGGVDKLSLTVDEQPEQEITPERVAGLFEQLQRIKTVAQLEKLLTGMAAKQLGGA